MGRNFFWGWISRDPPRVALLEGLGRLLDQGRPPDQALTLVDPRLARTHPRASGERLTPTLARAGLLDPGEASFLEAAEDVGRLPVALASLAQELRQERMWLRNSLARAAYPLLVLHLALFPMQIPRLLSSGFGPALRAAGLWLLALDTLLLMLLWFSGRAWRRGTLEDWPLLGRIYRARQRRRALFMLAELHATGVLWDQALLRAAKALRAPRLSAALASAAARTAGGLRPSQAVSEALELPEPFRGQLAVGEASGDMEGVLERCRKELDLSTAASQELLTRGLGAGLYALAVGLTVLVLVRAVLAIYAPLL